MNKNRHVYGERRQDWLDWLRGTAILMVVGAHYQIDWHKAGFMRPAAQLLMRVGWSGVDLFFVISGFLIGNLLLSERARCGAIDLPRFYVRRFSKIWPLFYTVPIIYILTAPFLLGISYGAAAAAIVPALAQVQNYFPLAMGHLWSLAVEEHFYLFLPLLLGPLAAAVRRFPGGLAAVLLTLIALVTIIRLFTVYQLNMSAQAARLPTHLRIDSLLFGVLTALVYQVYPRLWVRLTGARWVVLAFSATMTWVFAFNPNHDRIVAGLGFTALYLMYAGLLVFISTFAAAAHGFLSKPLAGLAWVGRYSYPTYLYHPFLWLIACALGLNGMVERGTSLSQGASWIVGLVAFYSLSIGVGWSVGFFAEKPLLALRNRLAPPRAAAFSPEPVAAIDCRKELPKELFQLG